MSKSTDPPVLSFSPSSVAPRRWAVLLLLIALLSSGLGLVAAVAPAQGKAVPATRCGTLDLGSGICVADPRGGLHWLGTRRGYDGLEVYCIDYLFSTRWAVENRRTVVTGSLVTSLGGKVAPATLAVLTALVTRHPADRVDDTTAAAISLVIRQVMGDVQRGGIRLIPGGLTADGAVRDVAFVPDAVVERAALLWTAAGLDRGPWNLRATLEKGPDGQVTLGERVDLVVRARSAAGKVRDATVQLGYRGFSGPASVRLGKDGAARVALTAPRRPTSGSVTARIATAPSAQPLVIVPLNWSVNRNPGRPSSVTQRGLIGRQAPVVARAWAKAAIVKRTPTVSTVVSAQRVEPGAQIHDTVIVSGTRGASSSFRWALLGPVKPLPDGRCPGVGATAWRAADVIVVGTVQTRGDGTYATPRYVVRRADVGCLTYTERLASTATTNQVSTPPGVAQETVLVLRPKSNPCVRTVASRQSGIVGQQLFDRVWVGCISPPDRVQVSWVARGPIAPATTGSNGCDRTPATVWRKAPIVARGSFVATKPGTFTTEPFTVKLPGCYTFSETVPATATSTSTSTPPGVAVETALFTRPPVPQVPVVPTGPSVLAGGSLLRSDTYAGRVQIGAARISARVTKVGISDGAMVIPGDATLLGWLRQSAWAADVVGSSVVAGHVTSPSGRPGSLQTLGRVRPGASVVWTDAGGKAHRFVVTTTQTYPRSQALPSAIFRTDGPHVLRLITCTDRVRRADGSHHYATNLVVTARAVA